MENSRKIMSGGGAEGGSGSASDAAEWFVMIGERGVGPMTVAEVFEKIQLREITWVHFAWKEGESGWRRLCDIEVFAAGVPARPAPSVQKKMVEEIQKSPAARRGPPPAPRDEREPSGPRSEDEKIWFLYYNDAQFGPFSGEEIRRFLRIGKIHGKVHAWKDPMENWLRIEKIGEFQEVLGEVTASRAAPPAPAPGGKAVAPAPAAATSVSPPDQRATPRRPLVAKIYAATGDQVSVGMCRDISVGGMQVLTDRLPGGRGARVKLNVSPAGGEKGGGIQPFVAEGVIVRILEDGRGFSFRFQSLPEPARKAIEAYIAAPESGGD
jgi:hypothetical protein